MKDNLYTGKEARQRIMNGIVKASQAVGVTLGTAGKNSLIECLERPGYYVTNDGFSILNSIKFADSLEELGRKQLVESVNRANKEGGDGSSTTCVLTAAILEEGENHLEETSPMEIKKSLERCLPVIEKELDKQTKQITIDDVSQVATISAEDEKIGQTIQEIYKKIGKDGIIQWEASKTAEDSYSIGTGLVMEQATYVSPYMCDMDAKTGMFQNTIKIKNPKVLLSRQKITSVDDLSPLLEVLYRQGTKELVIFCEEIEPIVVGLLIGGRFRENQSFRTVVVKMPVLFRDEWWEDLALASGATIVDPAAGTKLSDLKEEYLGEFGNITIDKEDTYLDGIKDITAHIANLQAEGSDKSRIRAARLNTRTARYYVGAYSENALAYRRLKVEDAINASSCALEHGIVPGGGIALFQALKALPEGEIGSKILRTALKAPLVYIITNSGYLPVEGEMEGKKMIHLDKLKKGEGFNSQTGGIENMLKSGIIDAKDIVLNAIRNAIGVSASVLTFGTIVTIPEQEVQPVQYPR